MKELRSEIEIQASAERVWQLLTDFPSFPQWNPFIRKATGNIRVGAARSQHPAFRGKRDDVPPHRSPGGTEPRVAVAGPSADIRAF